MTAAVAASAAATAAAAVRGEALLCPALLSNTSRS